MSNQRYDSVTASDERTVDFNVCFAGLAAEINAKTGLGLSPLRAGDAPDAPRRLSPQGLRSALAAFCLSRCTEPERVLKMPLVTSREPESPASTFAVLGEIVKRAVGSDAVPFDRIRWTDRVYHGWMQEAYRLAWRHGMAVMLTEHFLVEAAAGDTIAAARVPTYMNGLGQPMDMRSGPNEAMTRRIVHPRNLVAYGRALGQIPPNRHLAATCELIRYTDEARGEDDMVVFGQLTELLVQIYR